MTHRSLRARLWIGAALSLAAALLVASLGLERLFERHVERRIGAELTDRLNDLIAALEVAPDGALGLAREPLDPGFEQPLSGLYWQIDGRTDGVDTPGLLRSRSLWDEILTLPDDSPAAAVRAYDLAGPAGQRLLARERRIELAASGAAPWRPRLVVARDHAELSAARAAFAADLRPYLLLIALVLAVAAQVQIHAGLAPLEAVRRGVGAIRAGTARRLTADYPDEVMPLVSEVNALLDARAAAVERARAWTADLAHGLKTPLGALMADAERLRQQGQPALAADLEHLAESMRRRVERELVRARVRSGAASHQARVDVADAIERLLRTLRRTPDGARLAWRVAAPAAPVRAALMPEDLLELLGNLLENAAQWARASVWLSIGVDRDGVLIHIADDGPGVPAAKLPRLGERGLRLDQTRDGSGLGLAIVRDVVDAYGGTLAFDNADRGGLEISVRLPAARSEAGRAGLDLVPSRPASTTRPPTLEAPRSGSASPSCSPDPRRATR